MHGYRRSIIGPGINADDGVAKESWLDGVERRREHRSDRRRDLHKAFRLVGATLCRRLSDVESRPDMLLEMNDEMGSHFRRRERGGFTRE